MSLYDRLPNDILAQFYYEIKQNIEKGMLTEKMYIELDLIIEAAEKRGIQFLDTYSTVAK